MALISSAKESLSLLPRVSSASGDKDGIFRATSTAEEEAAEEEAEKARESAQPPPMMPPPPLSASLEVEEVSPPPTELVSVGDGIGVNAEGSEVNTVAGPP